MNREIFGNREAKKAMESAQELGEKIAKIKQEDPEGWAKEELETAKGLAVDAIGSSRLPKDLRPDEELKELQKIEKLLWEDINKINSLPELQAYIEQQGITQEIVPDFEEFVYDNYINQH